MLNHQSCFFYKSSHGIIFAKYKYLFAITKKLLDLLKMKMSMLVTDLKYLEKLEDYRALILPKNQMK